MSNRVRIGVMGVYHETNTFAPGLTEWDAFQVTSTWGRDAFLSAFAETKTTMGGVIDVARLENVELLPGVYATATPSGMVSGNAARMVIDELVRSVTPDIDGLLIIFHGAMVSEHHLDMETAVLREIRKKTGLILPIAVTVDLHANLGEEMIGLCDLLIGYDTYPHTDAYERGEEALRLLMRQIRKEIKPIMMLSRPHMLVVPQKMVTTEGAMKEIMEAAFQMERHPEVLNVTVCGGFPYSDIPQAGMSFVVTTNGNEVLARSCAEKLSGLAWKNRDRFRFREKTGEDAIQDAGLVKEGPIIVVEGSDNVGGGAPADGTHLLPALLRHHVSSLIVIRDKEAVKLACELGIGASLACCVGGKSDKLHGSPVPIDGKIRMLFDGKYKHRGPYMTGSSARMGRTAVVEAKRVTLVLTEERVPPWDIGHISSIGLDPCDYHLIVVKSAVAWRSAFGPYAKQVIEADTPGCCTASLHRLAYSQLQRPIFPFDFTEKENEE
ncbi:hypothetical protein GC098_09225 [Paenibacillus sp. LMG 31458]|uniref:M81 family peptidase n=1 Tax=Paenibacillus phytorum TaxID=2654977 RepID=A0ABX1XU69_9BACL|nr:M81 family metallopeptidase [Paenibacillus phytorum]NOU71601.1 hypothetical protein [Paenibacillus phytorum]